MKNFKLRMMLIIAVLLVCEVSFAQTKMVEPAIKLNTYKWNGYTVDEYDRIRVYKKVNGDFYSESHRSCEYALFKLGDGTIIEFGDDVCIKGGIRKERTGTKIKFKNGNYLLSFVTPDWDWFNDKDYNCQKVLRDCRAEAYGYVLAKEPDKIYEITKKVSASGHATYDDEYDKSVFIKGSYYKIDTKNGNISLLARIVPSLDLNGKFVDSVYVYSTPQDSILYCIKTADEVFLHGSIYKVVYANGDEAYITEKNDFLMPGTRIHRKNGIFEYKKVEFKEYALLTLNDGRKFKTDVYNGFKEGILNEALLLSEETLTPNNGLMINKDNTGVVIEDGMTSEEKKAKENAERQQKEKLDKEKYNSLCKKFGKANVDAALKGQIRIGMPEVLFVAVFKPTLKQQSGNKKQYNVYGWGTYEYKRSTTITNNQLKKIVWVTNGKVSSIRNIN